MSRSRKKVAVWKLKNDRYFKRLVHKRGRRNININNRQYKYSVNPYDICDFCVLLNVNKWWLRVVDEDIKKALRK